MTLSQYETTLKNNPQILFKKTRLFGLNFKKKQKKKFENFQSAHKPFNNQKYWGDDSTKKETICDDSLWIFLIMQGLRGDGR